MKLTSYVALTLAMLTLPHLAGAVDTDQKVKVRLEASYNGVVERKSTVVVDLASQESVPVTLTSRTGYTTEVSSSADATELKPDAAVSGLSATIDVEGGVLRIRYDYRAGAGIQRVGTAEAAHVASHVKASLPALEPRSGQSVEWSQSGTVVRATVL